MPNKPIIVHLARLYLPHLGGVEKHLFELTSPQKFSNYIITEQHDSSLPLKEKRKEVTVLRLPLSNNAQKISGGLLHKVSIWKGVFSSLSLLKSADIIHIHDVFWWLLPFLPFIQRKKIFITFHGYEGNDAPSWKQIWWHKLAAWYTQGNICIGDFHKKWYQLKPTIVSYGAVKKNRSITTHQRKNKFTKIIFAGRLSDDTGIFEYIYALKIIFDANKNIHLDVFGDGLLREKIAAHIKTYNLPIQFHGWIPPEHIPWENYDLAFVSRYLSILEAMQNNLPIIAHANNEIKYDYLALAPFASWIQIAKTPTEIVTAFENRKKLSPVAHQWVNKQTWVAVSHLYIQLWLTSPVLTPYTRKYFTSTV